MPDPLGRISALAESAIVDIALIVKDFTTVNKAAGEGIASVGRFSGPLMGHGYRHAQLALANIVAIVEHYTEQVLLEADCPPRRVRTWVDKVSSWSAVFSVNIEDPSICPSFVAMRGFYEARTAIVHRGGELTQTQRNGEVFLRLDAAGIERSGFRLIITPETVDHCAVICRLCIGELDAARAPS